MKLSFVTPKQNKNHSKITIFHDCVSYCIKNQKKIIKIYLKTCSAIFQE